MAEQNDKNDGEFRPIEYRPMTEEERKAFMERWARELPKVRRETKRGIANLKRIGEGKHPIPR